MIFRTVVVLALQCRGVAFVVVVVVGVVVVVVLCSLSSSLRVVVVDYLNESI